MFKVRYINILLFNNILILIKFSKSKFSFNKYDIKDNETCITLACRKSNLLILISNVSQLAKAVYLGQLNSSSDEYFP